MHFEDIWNEAEELSKQITDNSVLSILKRLREYIDTMVFAQGLSQINERDKAFGDILFELCAFCKAVEKQDSQINSATALRNAIEKRKIALFDGNE